MFPIFSSSDEINLSVFALARHLHNYNMYLNTCLVATWGFGVVDERVLWRVEKIEFQEKSMEISIIIVLPNLLINLNYNC